MALIVCTECGKEISDKAEMCPHCGNPINVKPVAEEKANELSVKNKKKKKKERTPLKRALRLWLLVPLELVLLVLATMVLSGDDATTDFIVTMGQLLLAAALVNIAFGLIVILKIGKIIKEAKEMKKSIGKAIVAIVLCIVFIIPNGFVGYSCAYTNNLITNSSEAKIAAAACEDLQPRMKNPESLTLHEVLVCKDFSDNMYVYIDCSAENSFGGVTRNIHIYKNGTYLGDWEYQSFEIREAKSVLDTCKQYDMYKSIPLSPINRKLK